MIARSVVASVIMSFPLVVSAASAQTGASTGPNNVYIEQVGNTNTVTIQQIGGSNNVGGIDNATPSSTNYATISGSSNTVTLNQTGDNNLGQYNIKGGNNVYTSNVTGFDNKTKLTVGDANNASNMRNTITETITGDTNTVIQTIVGNDNLSTLSINGNRNEVTKEITSSSAINQNTFTGNDNKLFSQQIGLAGANGHELQLVSSGDYNSYVVQQQGTNDTTVDIKTTGSHNTVTVRTSNSAIINPQTAVAR